MIRKDFDMNYREFISFLIVVYMLATFPLAVAEEQSTGLIPAISENARVKVEGLPHPSSFAASIILISEFFNNWLAAS